MPSLLLFFNSASFFFRLSLSSLVSFFLDRDVLDGLEVDELDVLFSPLLRCLRSSVVSSLRDLPAPWDDEDGRPRCRTCSSADWVCKVNWVFNMLCNTELRLMRTPSHCLRRFRDIRHETRLYCTPMATTSIVARTSQRQEQAIYPLGDCFKMKTWENETS